MEISLLLLVSVSLMLIGIAASLAPGVPAGPFPTAALLIYWLGTGRTEPGILALVLLLSMSIFVMIIDVAASVIGAKLGGSDNSIALKAGIIGILLFFVLGPLGLVIGIGGSVFLMEYFKSGDLQKSIRAAIYTGVSVLTSVVVKAFLTVSILILFLVSLYI